MNGIKEWTTVICLAALASSLLEFISPSGAMEKMVKYILGAFMLFAIISPIATFSPDFNLNGGGQSADNSQSGFSDTVQNQYNTAVQGRMETLVQSQLSEISIRSANVSIIMDTNKDNCISITKIIIDLPSQYTDRQEEVRTTVEKKLGIKTEIKVQTG